MTNSPARTPFRLFAAGLALTAFLAAGCGVDGKDDASSNGSTPVVDTDADTSDDSAPATTAEPTDDTSDDTTDSPAGLPDPSASTTEPTDDTTDDGPSSGGGSIPNDVKAQVIDLYVDMGFSRDQASCLTDKFMDSGATEFDTADMSKIMDWFGDCDISMSDLSKIGAAG